MSLRLGVLGAGGHSRGCHAPPLQRLATEDPDLTLAAICDLDEARARDYADTFGFAAVYTDAAVMLAEAELDGLVCVTPLDLTAKLVPSLLPAEVPLLIEKPPGANPQEAIELLTAVETAGVPHLVSLNRRFHPGLQRALAWIAEQPDARAPRQVNARMLRHRRREDHFASHTGIHLVDAVCSILGHPRRVTSHRLAGNHCPSWQATLHFDSGAVAGLCLAPDCGRAEESYEILGEDYAIQINASHGDVATAASARIVCGNETVLDWHAADEAPAWELNGTLAETRAFIAALRGTGPWAPDLRAATASFLAAWALDEGGETVISLPDPPR